MSHLIPVILFVGLVVVGIACGAFALWAGSRLGRAGRPKFASFLAPLLGLQLVQCAFVVVALFTDQWSVALYGGGIAAFVGIPAIIRWRTKGTGKRVALATLVAIVVSGVLGMGLTFAFTRYVLRAFVATSPSMSPTLEPRDRFLVDLLDRRPVRWDVVVYTAPDARDAVWVSRIAGLPGESVEIREGMVYINGAAQPTPAAIAHGVYSMKVYPGRSFIAGEGHPLQLGPDEYFVLGDNTEAANDSRYWEAVPGWGHQAGALPRSKILGVAFFRYSPHARLGLVR